ncbi:mannitol dehydrogenase domain-containing protein [Tirmania nivea]|nr:mannitol dehydrogenase domain-containing protein [Tirmania nivea]
MVPRALQFGAGSIGRGFIGALLTQSGYHVTFADVNQSLIDAINEDKEYHIHILLPDGAETITTSGRDISGCNSNSQRIIEEIVSASIITTAVGPDVLKYIAPILARGFSEKRIRKEQAGEKGKGPEEEVEYLNVIACENRVGASSLLKELVLSNMKDEKDKQYLEEYIGFPNCSVDRIVPPRSADKAPATSKDHPTLDVDVELFNEWIVERNALKGNPPFPKEVKGMQLTGRLEAYVERKLFTLNTGHAMTAYLGFLKGYDTISESIHDEEVARNVRHAMQESGAALQQKYNFDPEAHAVYMDKIIDRFRNPHLKDECVRVGREPLRKLGRSDRFVGPAQLCKDYRLPNKHLCRGIAAVMRYENDDDPQSVELRDRIKQDGVEKVAIELSGWTEDDAEIGHIMRNYKDLEKLQTPRSSTA